MYGTLHVDRPLRNWQTTLVKPSYNYCVVITGLARSYSIVSIQYNNIYGRCMEAIAPYRPSLLKQGSMHGMCNSPQLQLSVLEIFDLYDQFIVLELSF